MSSNTTIFAEIGNTIYDFLSAYNNLYDPTTSVAEDLNDIVSVTGVFLNLINAFIKDSPLGLVGIMAANFGLGASAVVLAQSVKNMIQIQARKILIN